LDIDLGDGWHTVENQSWRWTERVFSVRLRTVSKIAPTIRFHFSIPEPLVKTGPLRIHALVGDSQLPSCEYRSPGGHTYVQTIPAGVQSQDDLLIRFELDKAWSPGNADVRELGVQVVFWKYDGPAPKFLAPITLS